MNISVNPATWASFNLSLRNKQFDDTMRVFLNQLSQFAIQLQQQMGSATYLASVLNGSGALSPSATSQLSLNATETANRTLSASGQSVVSLNLNVTGAINYTLTINSLGSGTIVLLRLTNNSGGVRTFTVLATGYTVYLIGTGALTQLSSGVSIANGAAWNGIGTVNGATLLLVGGVGS